MSPTSFQTAPPRGNMKFKADDRTRTDNLLITNQLLCQLSHIGLFKRACHKLFRQVQEKHLNGWRRIRTFEGGANRFTVCPLWPLGNPSIHILSETIYVLTRYIYTIFSGRLQAILCDAGSLPTGVSSGYAGFRQSLYGELFPPSILPNLSGKSVS